MSQKLKKAEEILLNKINTICNKFGLNNIMAQLYAVLYVSDRPLSLHDMMEKLHISKASASINIRALERYEVVRRVWVKGTRRDYYEAETDIGKVILERIKSMSRSRLSELDDMISASANALDGTESDSKEEETQIRIFKERIDKLKDLRDKADKLMTLIDNGIVATFLK